MRILVTVANRFTGRHLIACAQTAEHDCISFEADLRNYEAVASAIVALEFDFVVHFAAVSLVGNEDLLAFYDVNVIGTENLFNALVKTSKNPRKVLVASSANVYGGTDLSPISESQPIAPLNHNAYSKVISEFVAGRYVDYFRVIIARPFNYTGVGQSTRFVIPKIAQAFATNQQKLALGNIDVRREFNDVRFIVSTYLDLPAIDNVGLMILNICSGKAYSLLDVMNTLTQLTGHKLITETDPRFISENEISSLYGDPTRLNGLLKNSTLISLEDTLQEMLAKHEGS